MLCHFSFYHTEAKNVLKSQWNSVPRCFHEIYFFYIFSVKSNLVTWIFLFIAKLFANARLFTIFEVNWQIGHGQWLTIPKLFTIKQGFRKRNSFENWNATLKNFCPPTMPRRVSNDDSYEIERNMKHFSNEFFNACAGIYQVFITYIYSRPDCLRVHNCRTLLASLEFKYII